MMQKNKKSAHTLENISPQIKVNKKYFNFFGIIVFIIGVLSYANTLTHQYTQDDAIVIYDNMFTTQGIQGIKGLFTKDTFFGFFKVEGKDKIVSGGRYRPLTPAMFAIEYQCVGSKPWLGHLMNILWYGLLCFMIYQTIALMYDNSGHMQMSKSIAFIAALLFALHPIHTEAVANIKGRDEIMSMLGAIVALYFIIKSYDTKQKKYIYLGMLSFFIGLLSKENTITFLAVIPAALYFFRGVNFIETWRYLVYLMVVTCIFLVIRFAILGADFGGVPMELMNNPFILWDGEKYVIMPIAQKMATILYTLGKYIWLLCLPHPLTHDYYPRHIDIMHLSDWQVLLTIVVYTALIIIMLRFWKKRSVLSFCIFYYISTLSIVSNIVFPIGTNMSERFLFMPSLGFALALGHIVYTIFKEKSHLKWILTIVSFVSVLYFIKTVTRNTVWKNDFTLFTTDVHTSTRSAKVLNAAGGALTNEAMKIDDITKKASMLTQAVAYLDSALIIHPTYKNAYLIKGNAHYYLNKFDNAINDYEQALRLDPDFADAYKNLAVALRDGGRYAGEKEQNMEKAYTLLNRAYSMQPDDTETIRLLGVLSGVKGNHDDAVKYFKIVTQKMPENADAFLNLSTAFQLSGDLEASNTALQKALQLNPDILKNRNAQ